MGAMLCLEAFVGCSHGLENADNITGVYIVTLKHAPTSHYSGELRRNGPERMNRMDKHKPSNASRTDWHHGSYTELMHTSLLRKVLKGEKYVKLYSYHYLIHGFAVLVTSEQAERLSKRDEVSNVVSDFSVGTATTYTPQFLGLPQGAWAQQGGFEAAGEGVVIGFVDTGIDPSHISFSDETSERPYSVPKHFAGVCEATPDFPSGSCNRKLVGARHFAASAVTRGIFNATKDHASPLDDDGHGTHTAAIAAGNHGVEVVVAGHHFGSASGMAPRAHIAVYKALYGGFGGFAADVVAAIDQAAQDGVDIISLSITPNRRPPGIATFFNPIDMALLSAVKVGIFVVQAAGNTGPSPRSMSSFSPWIYTVGAAAHDRVYSNSIVLGNNVRIPGVGLAPGTRNDTMYTLVSAIDALNDSMAENDMYVNECQESGKFNKDAIQGNLLICTYSVRFVLELSSIEQAVQTAKNLSAAGVVFCMDPFINDYPLGAIPMAIPGIILATQNDSQVLLQYYNSTVKRDESTKIPVKFGGVASIAGGIKANFIVSAPKVMFYSARGPDPEDTSFDDAAILKPNIVAPGNSIWAAWGSRGTNSVEFQGESFAMMSGTSMAAPHVAGIAALIKQRFPSFSPSAVGSAISTTASLYERSGRPIMAQRAYVDPDLNQSPATPFDMGSGFVNATGALNPGLIFNSNYDDYISFLCGVSGSSQTVLNYTGRSCGAPTMNGGDLNLPSVTIPKLNGSVLVQRTVTNVGANETYSVRWSDPYGSSVKVSPARFSIGSGEKQVLNVSIYATTSSSVASFGRIGLVGTGGHVVNVPLSVVVKIAYNATGR